LDRAAHVSVKKKTKRTATKRVKKERL